MDVEETDRDQLLKIVEGRKGWRERVNKLKEEARRAANNKTSKKAEDHETRLRFFESRPSISKQPQ